MEINSTATSRWSKGTCLSKYIIENNDHSAKLWLKAPRAFVIVTLTFFRDLNGGGLLFDSMNRVR